MPFKWILGFFVVLSPCFATSFSFGESLEMSSDSELIDLIMQNKSYCVEDISEGNIYLTAKRVLTTREGVFLRLNRHDLVRLSILFSNEKGCFIPLNYSKQVP
ncbi:MAG TPA: hypothetical protein DCE71_01120 [Parachlamydiales bacterium]|nr:hypothetical protein [Parachlamydiales bacterium]